MSNFFEDDAKVVGNSFFEDDAKVVPGQKSSFFEDDAVVLPEQPQPTRTLAISRNLENELRNVGVDPATMKVFRSDKDLGLVGKIGRWFRSGNAQMKMDLRMAEAANSKQDVYAEYRMEEILYKQAVAANPIVANNIIEQEIFNISRSWGYCSENISASTVTGGLTIGVVMALLLFRIVRVAKPINMNRTTKPTA